MDTGTPRLTNRRVPRISKNSGTPKKEFSMARHEKEHGQICAKLPYVPTQYTTELKDPQMAQTAGSTATTMEGFEHGLCGRTTGK
jgi:hypothetical protein